MSTSTSSPTAPTTTAAAPWAVRWCAGLSVLSAAATGLVAGIHLSGLPLAEALRALEPEGYTTTKQALDVSYPKLMKPLLLAALALLAASVVVSGLAERRRVAVASGAALAAGVVVLVAVLRGDLPLNQQVAGWDPLSPPAGWEAVRAEWERWFVVRAVASGAAFAAALVALVTAVSAAARPPTALSTPSTPRGRRTGSGTAGS